MNNKKETVYLLNAAHNFIMSIIKYPLILYVLTKLFPEYIQVDTYKTAFIVVTLYTLIGLGLSIVAGFLVEKITSNTVANVMMCRIAGIMCHIVTIAIINNCYNGFSMINTWWAYIMFYYVMSSKLNTK